MPEKNYRALGAKAITQPSKSAKRPRIMVYAKNKKGKTRFALTVDEMPGEKILVLDAEHGTDRFKGRNPDVWHIGKWEEVANAVGYLRTGDHPYTYVALDTVTRINNMALKFVGKTREASNLETKPGMVDRRDYNKSGELMKDLVVTLDALPLGVIYLAQERTWSPEGGTDDETDEAGTFYVPDVPQGVRGSVNSIVDVIGRLYVAKAQFKNPMANGLPIEKNQRRLWIDVHPQYDTGYRSEHELPEMVKSPTVAKIVQLLEQGA